MSFEHPGWLWLLAPALALAIADAVRRWPGARLRRAAAIAARVVVIAALAAAASGPRWVRHEADGVVVFLIDRSGSVSDDALARAWAEADALHHGRAGVILFDGDAEVAIAPGAPWVRPATLRAAGRSRDATDVAGAIRLGLGLIPPDAGGHLVLLGDGRATTGDLAAATAAAAARGVPISVVPSPPVAGDPAVAAIVLDADRVKPASTVGGRVEIDAGGEVGTAHLVVQVAGAVALDQDVALDGKAASVPFSYALPDTVAPGTATVTATLTPRGAIADADPADDRAAAPLVVEPAPKILILDGDDNGAAPLAAALRAEKMDVTITSAVADAPAPELAGVDLVILANAPVRGGIRPGVIDDAFGEKLVRWVDDGGGLLVLGGPSALDSYYADNRLADALPIELEPSNPELDAAATVIVILDMSGSMGEEVDGRTKLALAAEGAAAVIRLLRSFDVVGVESVEDIVHWTVPMRPIGDDAAKLEAQVRDIPVGGDGIFVYTSLIAAEKAMKQATTPLRHVILFSDTFDAAEQVKGIDYGGFQGWPSKRANSFDVARRLRAMGATLSVIGVGEGADNAFDFGSYYDDNDDTDFLRQLAVEGGGRYYRTSDARSLRALFVQDAQRLIDSNAREEDIKLQAIAHHAALDGIDLAKAPALHGYQDVKPRPAAQVVVTDNHNDPIWVRWPYGLGEVAVWASDAGPRWAGDWLKWPSYGRFWTQMVRSALRRHEGDATALEVAFAGDRATVRVVQRGAGGAVTARVIEGGVARPLPLDTTSPGVREGGLDVAPGHDATVELVDGAGKVIARRAVVPPPPAELRFRGPDVAALTALARATGGAVAPRTVAPAGGALAERSWPLSPWLVALALLLLPLDAWLRRAARAGRARPIAV